MDYEGIRKLAVAASGMPAGMFGRSDICDRHWLYVGTCLNYDVPGRQLTLISLSLSFLS